MKAKAIILICLIILSSCKTKEFITHTDYETITMRDTTIITKPDNASIEALLECDSIGNVRIKEMETIQGNNLRLSAMLNNNKLIVNSLFPSLNIVVNYPEKLKTISTERTIEVNKLSKFQKIQIAGFWILSVLLLLIIKCKL